MSERLVRVADRMRSEVEAIAGVVDRAEEGMHRAVATRDPFYWDSVALSLLGFQDVFERGPCTAQARSGKAGRVGGAPGPIERRPELVEG